MKKLCWELIALPFTFIYVLPSSSLFLLNPYLNEFICSCSAKVFGVSAKSMQCSYDERGNSVPTILLMMQKRLYSEGGLKVCSVCVE